MKTVSQFESSLLTILRNLFQPEGNAESRALLVRKHRQPKCLSRNCVDLIRQYLSTGLTQWASAIGWRQQRFPSAKTGQLRSGRIWQRANSSQLALHFSPNSVEWLLWLTTENIAAPIRQPFSATECLTLGDQLLLFLTVQQHRESLVLPGLLSVPQIQTHGLVWLFETDSLRQSESHSNWSPNFQPWLTVDNVWVIESLLIELAQNTFQLEMSRRQLARPQDVMQSGRLLTSGIQRFLNAADSVGRRDLGIFVLHTARQLLHAIPTAEHWLPEVNQQSLRLAERTELLRAGMAIFHQTAQLHQWQQEAIATGFYDEEYQAAQFWKSLWEEANGEDTWLRVSERIKNSASLLAAADSE